MLGMGDPDGDKWVGSLEGSATDSCFFSLIGTSKAGSRGFEKRKALSYPIGDLCRTLNITDLKQNKKTT